jgi:ATP-dependent protease ClpP protease subunit
VREVALLDVTALTVRINSYGGSVTDGVAIHNALKRHKATVTTVIDGIAASIASLIAMAGDTVEMADNAMLMIHAPWMYTGGNSASLREDADMLDSYAEAMATSYIAKTGGDKAEILALLQDGKDHWYTAEQAIAAKFADVSVAALPLAASAGLNPSIRAVCIVSAASNPCGISRASTNCRSEGESCATTDSSRYGASRRPKSHRHRCAGSG